MCIPTLDLTWVGKLPLQERCSRDDTFKKTLRVLHLRDTHLYCMVDSPAGEWESRKQFIQQMVENMVHQCPRDKPVVLLSLGSGKLLVEYVVGRALIEQGFSEISFFLVDIAYKLEKPEEIQPILSNFRSLMERIYSQKFSGRTLSPDRIVYLSRMQNIGKYFPRQACVAVLENLPPIAKVVNTLRKNGLDIPEENLLCGNLILTPEHANAVALIPPGLDTILREQTTQEGSLPVAIFGSPTNKEARFIFDWGYKIRSDGTFMKHFTHLEEFCNHELSHISDNALIRMPTGELITKQEVFPLIQKAIEAEIKKTPTPLDQSKMTALLQKIASIASTYMPALRPLYLADYSLDREASMKYLREHANFAYRRAFTLRDVGNGFQINVEAI